MPRGRIRSSAVCTWVWVPKTAVTRFLTGMPAKFESATGLGRLNGVIVTADQATGKATALERLNLSSADVDALAPHTAVGR